MDRTDPMRARTEPIVAFALPVYNEADGIDAFHKALVAATATRPDLTFEFYYVDDGSADDSLSRLERLAEADPRVSVVALSRNFGHQVAVTAGLEYAAHADAVVIMDTDLQDPPTVALELIAAWESGVDVAYAQRRTRKDGAFKRASAFGFYWALDKLAETEIPRNVGDFRALDRRVVLEVLRYREHDRFLRGIVAHVGFRQEAVVFDRDARHAGTTGYPLRKMLRLAADGVLGFSTAPLRLISRAGYLISTLSIVGVLYIAGVRIFNPADAVPGWAFLGVGVFLLGGIQIVMIGVVGSYLGRVYVEVQGRPLYSVARVIGGRRPTAESRGASH